MSLSSYNGPDQPIELLPVVETAVYVSNVIQLAEDMHSEYMDLLAHISESKFEEAATARDRIREAIIVLHQEVEWLLHIRCYAAFLSTTENHGTMNATCENIEKIRTEEIRDAGQQMIILETAIQKLKILLRAYEIFYRIRE